MMKKGSFYTFELFSVQDGLDWMDPRAGGGGGGERREGRGSTLRNFLVRFSKP